MTPEELDQFAKWYYQIKFPNVTDEAFDRQRSFKVRSIKLEAEDALHKLRARGLDVRSF